MISNLLDIGLKGKLERNVKLAPYTTIKIGGSAEWFFEPEDIQDLALFMQEKPNNLPITFLGEGSNIVIRDGGIEGVVIRTAKISKVEVDGNRIYAEAGATCGKVARAAREASLAGMEFYCGIPGSIGGALRMNAGAYGKQTSDFLEGVEVITDYGDLRKMAPEEMQYGYRHSVLPTNWMFASAIFHLKEGDKEEIRERMREINKERSTSQPLDMPSSGSWFKNPTQPDGKIGSAWRTVDAAGCRGMRIGGAQVSEKHCNFFVNHGNATSAEMEQLSTEVEKKIRKKLGIIMEREVRIMGRP